MATERGGSEPHRPRVRLGLRWRFTAAITGLTLALMAGVVFVVRSEISTTLERQLVERGLALARNLAFSATEPMSVASVDRALNLAILVPSYVQSGGGEAARRRLFERNDVFSQVLASLRAFGREAEAGDVQNEGVLAAVIVNPAGVVEAFADATIPLEEWAAKSGAPYAPPPGSGLLAPGEDSHLWTSTERNGMFVLGVPIVSKSAASTAPEAAAPLPPGEPAPTAPRAPEALGTVYLALSQGVVTRAVGRAIAFLLVVAAALLAAGAVLAVIIAAFLTGPIRRLQVAVRAIAAGDFNQRVGGHRARDEIGDLTEAFNDMAKGLAERETMRGAFATYVSKDLMEEILRNPDVMKAGGKRTTATVLFAYFGNHEDLPFLAQKLAPEVFVRIVNDYLEVEAKLIVEHNGYPDKFIGDGVMGVWGVPLDTQDHAERAVRCAVAIQKAVRELNETRAREGRVCTEISIGINTGGVVAGNIGSEGLKLDYTVISEDVNFAARLAGAGATFHGGATWVGQRTYEMVKDLAVANGLGDIEFKGLGPRPVWEVTDLRPVLAHQGSK